MGTLCKRRRMRLDRWLKVNDMTQAAFAHAIGFNHASVSRVVSGLQWPSAEMMIKIVERTGGKVTANDVFSVVAKNHATLQEARCDRR